ncbi:hypothetical protein [Rubripirellula obstinata]|uniref:hypothetical protein n=1 Tax=Rubripirellula obstinata TaxID=406547 RepID=UPI00082BF51F|nr:hypothetical protein [Rubripirellula obstinata]
MFSGTKTLDGPGDAHAAKQNNVFLLDQDFSRRWIGHLDGEVFAVEEDCCHSDVLCIHSFAFYFSQYRKGKQMLISEEFIDDRIIA